MRKRILINSLWIRKKMYFKKLPLTLLSICFTSSTFAASIPSISHLDSEIQRSINSLCSYAKQVEGPVKYIECLNKQLAELKTINISNQETEVTLQKLKPSNKDTKLSDAIKAAENGESHKIWLSLASEGIDNAQLILGVLYVKGLGVGKSMKDAANWIGLARQNGSMEVSEKAEEVWNEYELWKYE